MFEKETEQLIAAVRQSTIGDAKAIGLREIFESNIPSSVKVFFRAEVETMLAGERKTDSRSGKFNYELPEIAMLQDQIDALLIHNFIFPKSEFESTLDRCIHFTFNYLCRPQWTLISFLFEESARTSAQNILRKLRYCKEYAYFTDILRRYLQQRGVGEMTLEEGRNLIARIDSEVIKDHSSIELAQLAAPLYEFVAYARSHKLSATAKTVPTRALMYFFDDKKMTAIQERLTREREVLGVKELSSNQLVNMLEKVRTGDEHAHVFDETSEQLPAFEDVTSELPVLPAEYEEPSIATPVSSEPPRPLPPLFSIEEERMIIKHVFHQDEGQFRAALSEVSGATTWEDAAHSIDHFFLMNDVEPFSKEAILFTNRVQSRITDQVKSR